MATKRYWTISGSRGAVRRERFAAPLLGKEFSALDPKKQGSGKRAYTAKDIEIIGVLHDLLKRKGYTIDGAKRQLKQALKEHRQLEALRQRLEAIRAELVDIADDAERKARSVVRSFIRKSRTYSPTPSSRAVISRS